MKKNFLQKKIVDEGSDEKIREIDGMQDDGVGTKVKYNLPKKIVANAMDGVGTKKLKTDSFSHLCDRILSQTQKMSNLLAVEQNPSMDSQFQNICPSPSKLTYDPHYHTGIIENYTSITSQQQKQEFGLINEGRCQHFTLNDQFLIVIVGRLPTSYCNGMNVGLYIPRETVQHPLTIRQNTKQLIIIQRRSTTSDPNFLNYPYIIIQPQLLLYPSYLCSWIQCKRRVSLINYISSEFEVNQHLVFGSACHRYMEWLLDEEVKVNLQSYEQWKTVIKRVYDSFLYDMYLVGATFERFLEYCQQSLTNIRQWVRMYILNKKQLQVNKYQRLYLRIEKVIGSETMHRSGYFGLKGKTDGLFKGKLINKKTNTVTQVFIPFELKTGKKPSQSHKRQTDIYNMLLRQREKTPVMGLLYYSQGNFTIFRQENKEVAFETIIIHRNTIVMNLKKLYQGQQILLPQLTTNGDNCKLCEIAVGCEIIQQDKRSKVKERQDERRLKEKQSRQLKRQQRKRNINMNKKQQKQSSMSQVIIASEKQPSISNPKIVQLNSLFDSDESQSQISQHYLGLNRNQETTNQLPLPSTYNPNAKLTLKSLTYPQRKYITSWLQCLHLQQCELKQQLQRNTSLGYSNFILKQDQLLKINQYFNSTKLQQKLTFSIQKKYKSMEEMHKLLANYTVSLKLRIIIQHLGIMEGCKITKLTKQSNKLILQVQMNSLQVVMNRKALEYSISNNVEHDVELERFENLQAAGWRWAIYRFVLGTNQRLKELVIDQYKAKELEEDKSIQKQLQDEKQSKQIGKQSQSTVDATNRDDGSKSKLILKDEIIIIDDEDNNNDGKMINSNHSSNINNNKDDDDDNNNDGDEVDIELSQLKPLTPNNQQQLSMPMINLQQQQPSLLFVKDNLHCNSPYSLTQSLNTHQLQAFNKVFSNTNQKQSYCTLVQGMPGTGKTQLIVKLILQAYLLKQTVLVTTYTNRSLDNILQRLFKQPHHSIPQQHIIRQGSRYSIDPKFETLNHRSYNFSTIQQYTNYFASKHLWFVTLSSINIHHIPKRFDLIILDQASQSLQPVCIEALNRGSKVVMIGDYKQLQPIVKSKKAGHKGMGVSLFERLCIKHPQMAVALRLQYRMNKEIMALSNKLVYDGQLKLGSYAVSNKTLSLPLGWQQSLLQPTLQQIISPSHPVVFLNHDGITNSLSSKHRSSYNQIAHILEIECGVYLYWFLLQTCGVKQQQIAIVCAYNKTVDVVNQMIQRKKAIKNSNNNKKSPQIIIDNKQQNNLSVNADVNEQKCTNNNNTKKHIKGSLTTPALTIDKSQGIDKQIIIFIVQAKSQENHGLLQSSRRMNVALTRAKTKLILIGSMKHLKQMQLWDGKLAVMLQQSTYSMTKPLIDYILGQFKYIGEQQQVQQNKQSKQQEVIRIIDEAIQI